MVLKIKIKKLRDVDTPKIISKGDWIDLQACPDKDNISYKKGNFALIPLGVAMKLPDGYEAHLVPRSSSFKNKGFIQTNSLGVVDGSYCGNNDEWKLPVYFLKEGTIAVKDRICQFRICLKQTATMWQKIKWLFTSKISFIEVDNLEYNNRGGFGSTGI